MAKDKNGFTLVELLAVMIILGLLMVIAIPAYSAVYSSIKRNNLSGKISEINAAAMKYGQTVKDEIKEKGNKCLDLTVGDLVERGYILSEEDNEPAIMSPVTGKPLDGVIKICYCNKDFDIKSYYTVEFVDSAMYYPEDIVTIGNHIYKCMKKYPGDRSGIDASNEDGDKYFSEIKQDDC